ncbi:MAG: alpha-2-macroglobulin family protein [Sediminibacterium sp.]|nr:alpha-2-macroglobulin family protein [Sediminibacterium sp.]
MRTLLFILLLLCGFSTTAQVPGFSYASKWAEIDTLIIARDLPRSALTEVNKLYERAKREKQVDQAIKCLLYSLSIEEKTGATEIGSQVQQLKKELGQTAGTAEASILHILLAEKYERIFQDQRWTILGRKATTATDKTDIQTWSGKDFEQAIEAHYSAALQQPNLLYAVPLNQLNALVLKGNDTTGVFKNNLLDLLATEALEYYKSNESYSSTAFYQKPLSNPAVLSPAAVFMRTQFNATETGEANFKTIGLYQLLLQLHAQAGNRNMMARYDADRIEWANKNSQFANKTMAYRSALNQLLQYNNNTISARALYLQAALEVDLGSTYAPFGDTTNRFAMNSALKIIGEAKQLLGKTTWEQNGFHRLYQQINKVFLSGKIEKTNLPDQPFRALISYQNLDTVYARIYKFNSREFLRYNYLTDYEKIIAGNQAADSFVQALPRTGDHQQHAVEIKIAGLSQGDYYIVFSSGKDFTRSRNAISTSHFTVSDLTYFTDGNRFFVRDLYSGKPVVSADVTIYTNNYQSNLSNNKRFKTLQLHSRVKTDRNGSFSIANPGNSYNNYVLEIQSNKKILIAETDEMNLYRYPSLLSNKEKKQVEYEKENSRMFFFTDRAVYRPGQQMQFKGIAVTKDYNTQKSKLIHSGTPVVVRLRNANQQLIDSVRCSLNEFGSITGGFRLPETGLTGRWYIEADGFYGSRFSFRMEEYKRPDLTVVMNRMKPAYHISDSIRIGGQTKANAGNAVGNTRISYTITASVYFTGRTNYYPERLPNIPPITGETRSDAKGNFEIPFTPDSSDRQYAIEVTATDNNGRAATQRARFFVATKEMEQRYKYPVTVNKNSFTAITADTTDAFGNTYNSKVIIRLYKAITPNRLIRKRLWQRPDQFVFSEAEFTAAFPNDEYSNESEYSSWNLTPLVQKDSILYTNNNKTVAFTPGQIEAGLYKYETRAFDAAGHCLLVSQYVLVYDQAGKQLPFPSYQLTGSSNIEVFPGDTASLLNYSSLNKRYITRKIKAESDTGEQVYQQLQADGNAVLNIPITEKHRGRLIVTDAFVAAGRCYTWQYMVEVPWNNKKLQVNYTSFRKESEPGSKETWTIEVLNHAGKPTEAELLSAMYDASLDVIAPQKWNVPQLWGSNNWMNQFGSRQFEIAESIDRSASDTCVDEFYFTRDLLATSGNDFLNYSGMNNNPTIFSDVWINNCNPFSSGPKQELYEKVFAMPAAPELRSAITTKQELHEKVFAMPAAPELRSAITTNMKIRGNSGAVKDEAAAGEIDATEEVQIRKNLNETAFFLPQLLPDSSGKIRFSFSLPEAVTTWKWMSLAHTKDLAFGSNTTTMITRKKIMVQPNAPRFLREGDHMEFSTRIANTSTEELSGVVTLELLDATTNRSVDGWFQNIFPLQHFTAGAGESMVIRFPIDIPFSFNKPLTWRVIAKAGNYSDGEEQTVPVLTNRQLVTETLPLYLPNDTTQQFRFNKLMQHNSEGATNQSFSVEYTVNPLWNAVMAIPAIPGPTAESALQLFHQLYAAELGKYILQRSPVIRNVLNALNKDSVSLQSNLEKNTALKQLLLEETPWVFAAANETQQMQQLARFFQRNNDFPMAEWLSKMEALQLPNGAFSWMKNGPEDRYITQEILTGIGRLKKLGAIGTDVAIQLKPMLLKALSYTDAAISKDYDDIIQAKSAAAIAPVQVRQIEYLYMRSFFSDIAISDTNAYRFFYNRSKTGWQKQNSYTKAMLALIAFRNNNEEWAVQQIVPSLLENSIRDARKGMFWKTSYTNSWFESPITHQSMLISCFEEINLKEKKYTAAIDAMRTWLLLNKQTNNWETAIATADACYALLLNGSNWLNNKRTVQIDLGRHSINSASQKTMAGSGYLKVNLNPETIVPEMGNIRVKVSSGLQAASAQPSYGGVYWQYFEELSNITADTSKLPLSVQKALFREQTTASGSVLVPIREEEEIGIGDKIVVQLTLRSDRDMEYVHLKDMRAASMEPLHRISTYHWQEGLGYYESTRDTRSDFFVGYLPKGTYLFRYETTATHAGRFSAGIATVQSMYAPEFSSHSAGITIRIKE